MSEDSSRAEKCSRQVNDIFSNLNFASFLVTRFSPSVSITGGDVSVNMTAALRDLYKTMDGGQTVPPLILLQVLHMAFPLFAERGEGGGYQQQDANECWMEVLRMLQVRFCVLNQSNKEGIIVSCTSQFS